MDLRGTEKSVRGLSSLGSHEGRIKGHQMLYFVDRKMVPCPLLRPRRSRFRELMLLSFVLNRPLSFGVLFSTGFVFVLRGVCSVVLSVSSWDVGLASRLSRLAMTLSCGSLASVSILVIVVLAWRPAQFIAFGPG